MEEKKRLNEEELAEAAGGVMVRMVPAVIAKQIFDVEGDPGFDKEAFIPAEPGGRDIFTRAPEDRGKKVE